MPSCPKKPAGLSPWLLIIVCACLLGLTASLALPAAATGGPGSEADPVVSQSWVDARIAERLAVLDQRLTALEQQLGAGKQIILTIGSREAQVNGETAYLDTAPQIMGAGYTMVPVRFVAEALALGVDWDPAARQVLFSGQGQQLQLTIGQKTAQVNGAPLALDYPPTIVNDRTLVHVRFVAEAFGCRVDWDPVLRQVEIRR